MTTPPTGASVKKAVTAAAEQIRGLLTARLKLHSSAGLTFMKEMAEIIEAELGKVDGTLYMAMIHRPAADSVDAVVTPVIVRAGSLVQACLEAKKFAAKVPGSYPGAVTPIEPTDLESFR